MANCSFLLKGWSVTLVAGLMALSVAVDQKIALVTIGFIPVIMFWILDGYFLCQERLFRALFEDIRKREESQIDFSMNTSTYASGKNTWFAATFSKTIMLFYLALALAMAAVIIFLVRQG